MNTHSENKKQIPLHEGLYTWPSAKPQLIASKCKDCGEVIFPVQSSCANCTGTNLDKLLLSRRGKLWSWTIQNFMPPSPPFVHVGSPENYVPFSVGYIELPEGLKVESRLTENDPAKLEIGMDMEVVVEKFMEDEEGNDLMTFAFQPVERR